MTQLVGLAARQESCKFGWKGGAVRSMIFQVVFALVCFAALFHSHINFMVYI